MKNKNPMTEDIKGVGEAHLLDTLVDDMDILLGKGSCGAVYSFKSSPTDVVKEIQLDGVPPTRLESLREDVNHFLHLDHPRVIKYQRVVWREGLLYIFMKRYSQSLDSVIKIYKRKNLNISLEKSLDIICQLASALAYLHSPDKTSPKDGSLPLMLHKNLRPTNILTDEDITAVVITDFGLCKDETAPSSTPVNALLYAAPETVLERKYSPSSDIWSLGIILYELVTGTRPAFSCSDPSGAMFTDNWAPDLSSVSSIFVRELLKRIFVLTPEDCITADELVPMLELRNNADAPMML
ncbi:Hypothetical protein DHA2_152774 [Giardia duodenalis]|uniref:non-specific serine/threonine protein kinase n=1 Tax=Giardia intestinalis TaxID=5741 RepID=V6TEZ9_GIAIN|nr:Hypothetical protein DHA2_152774 [Giardia intestinalis]